jgi:hypothetical protein
MKKLMIKLLVCIILFFTSLLFSQTFYFYLPWDDSTSNATDLSYLNHKPAGKYGFVTVGNDGHFYVGGQRIKFLGVDITAASCFPQKTQAEPIAKRLAKFGINVVRLHFLDNMWGFSIFGYPGSYTNTRSFNSDALDRLDYFIAKLKENGVYVNLNLLVGRNFLPGDGLPSSINNLDWKQKQVPAMFYQPMIELQKEYATNLLTRLNPYTSTYYNNEPAIAFVEIVNEHGLIQGWLDGTIDILPQEFAEDLRTKWNDWLLNKYQTHSNLLSSGWAIDEPLGPEILKNTDFSQGFLYWGKEVHDVAKASFTIVSGGGYGGSNAVKIVIENTSQTSWHVQFKQSNLVVFSTNVYTLSFYAKADRNISINVQLGMDHDPWNILGFDQLINLTTYYQYFSFQFMPSADDNNARVCFTNMCKELATYYFSNISFKKGGSIGLLEGENLDQKTMQIVKYSERNKRTKIAQKDWVNFLYDLEENYYSVMYNHIKNTIGFKGVVCGTTVGLTSVPNIQSKLDFVDTHSYWYHPVFPGTAWDMNNWYVTNATLVKDINGGTMSEIAVKRVYGKPFTISEYNHPSPNTFSSEAYIFLSAFAAYHDWDAIYGYTYLDGRTSFDNTRIEGFFDLNQHPTKFLTFIPAALIYRRGDVSANQDKFVCVEVNREDEVEQSLKTWAWRLIQADDKGLNRKISLLKKTAMIVENGPRPSSYYTPNEITLPTNNRYISDTNELDWDTANGVFKIDTQRTKVFLGYIANKTFTTQEGIEIQPKNTLQNGWANITLSLLDENNSFESLKNSNKAAKILLTATGSCGNPGMNWMIYPNTSVSFPPPADVNITVGNQWGTSPSFVEGINADIVLPYPKNRVKVYALDNKGERISLVETQQLSQTSTKFSISYSYQTLWYEIEVSSTETQVDYPPNVQFVQPQNGAVVSSSITITAEANDDFGVTKVEFYLNTTSLFVDYNSPYSFVWYSTNVANGNYYLKAVAYDTSGQTSTSTITITVRNQVYPLYITINPPNSGRVEKNPDKSYYLENEKVTLTAYPNSGYRFISFSGDISSTSSTVNIVMSSTKNVVANFEQISQPLDNPPTIYISIPENMQLSGSVEIYFRITDDKIVTKYILLLNDVVLSSGAYDANFVENTFVLDTSLYPNGNYQIKLVAYDNDNQISQITRNVSFNNIPGETPPSATIVGIENNEQITQTKEISVSVTTQKEIIKVEYYLGDVLVYTSTTTQNLGFVLNPQNFSEGSYVLTVVVYDSSGLTGTDSKIVVIKHETTQQPKQSILETYLLSIGSDDINKVVSFEVNNIQKIEVFNSKGKKIKEICTPPFKWDGKDERNNFVSSGVYFIKVSFNNGDRKIVKIIVIK